MKKKLDNTNNLILNTQRGITLIALIITIIVLLILAIVSIQLVMNNGIISKSEYGKDKYSEEEIGEQLKLAYAEYEMAQYDGSFDIQQRLQQIYGESTTAEIKNGKLNAKINGVDYRYNSKTGKAGKYVDPFDYKGKNKNELLPGDEITITKGNVTESFTVISNKNGKIVAMPQYNITITTDHPVQKQFAGATTFSSDKYWAKETGWNDSSKVVDNSVNINMTEKNEDETYKNNIQQYIDAYKQTLEDMGAEEISVRISTKQELDSELETALTDAQKQSIRNPGKSGGYWLGSGNPDYDYYVWSVMSNGTFVSDKTFHYNLGVRPIIEIY